MLGSETSRSNMFHYVYVIESDKNHNLYTGYTKDINNRLKEHNRSENFSTKPYLPWHLIYCELCINEIDAKRRENYLKTSQGARLIKRRLKEYFYNKKSRKIT